VKVGILVIVVMLEVIIAVGVIKPVMLILTLAGPGAMTIGLVVMLIELVKVGAGVGVETGWYPIAAWEEVPVAATRVKKLP
jgi:hypothetical protein